MFNGSYLPLSSHARVWQTGGVSRNPFFTLISVELAVKTACNTLLFVFIVVGPILHYNVTHVGCDQLPASVQLPVAASSGGSATAARV